MGDGVVLLLGGTCVFVGVGVGDYGVKVEVTEEMEPIKYQGLYCIILTVQHLK